jgi:hypothetical protein
MGSSEPASIRAVKRLCHSQQWIRAGWRKATGEFHLGQDPDLRSQSRPNLTDCSIWPTVRIFKYASESAPPRLPQVAVRARSSCGDFHAPISGRSGSVRPRQVARGSLALVSHTVGRGLLPHVRPGAGIVPHDRRRRCRVRDDRGTLNRPRRRQSSRTIGPTRCIS